MPSTSTRTFNYSIIRGASANSVNATITSTPGFSSAYLEKITGMLKVLQLLLAAVAVGLVASQLVTARPVDVFFLCAHAVALSVVGVLLMVYLFHPLTAILVPKTTVLEMAFNVLLAGMMLAAGMLQIVTPDKGVSGRATCGMIACANGMVFLASGFMASKEFAGPKGALGPSTNRED